MRLWRIANPQSLPISIAARESNRFHDSSTHPEKRKTVDREWPDRLEGRKNRVTSGREAPKKIRIAVWNYHGALRPWQVPRAAPGGGEYAADHPQVPQFEPFG
jgi:hypothetical protein